jgi:hypothetical protein
VLLRHKHADISCLLPLSFQCRSLCFLQVVDLTGRRAILCAGWSELASLIGPGPDQVQLPEGRLLVIPSAPHDWLLPRCCAAVHHAGVGTCAAALRAGVPSVPCPVMLDQPVMALRLLEAGVATPAIPFAKLTAEVSCRHGCCMVVQVRGCGTEVEGAASGMWRAVFTSVIPLSASSEQPKPAWLQWSCSLRLQPSDARCSKQTRSTPLIKSVLYVAGAVRKHPGGLQR